VVSAFRENCGEWAVVLLTALIRWFQNNNDECLNATFLVLKDGAPKNAGPRLLTGRNP
jgi:hypothetical protein